MQNNIDEVIEINYDDAYPCPVCKGEMKWTKVKLKRKTEEGYQDLGVTGKLLWCKRCGFYMNFVQDVGEENEMESGRE